MHGRERRLSKRAMELPHDNDSLWLPLSPNGNTAAVSPPSSLLLLHQQQQPDDIVNLSRDDSDVGGEYFLRETETTLDAPTTTTLHQNHLCNHWDNHGHRPLALLSPRRNLSGNSLYGEAIVHSMGRSGRCALRGRSLSPFLSDRRLSHDVGSSTNGSRREDALSWHGSSSATTPPPPPPPPLIHPQFRRRRDDFESVSDSSVENVDDNLSLVSPISVQLSCFTSGGANDDSEVTTTPPSIQYAPPLSPPPLVPDSVDKPPFAVSAAAAPKASASRSDSLADSSFKTTGLPPPAVVLQPNRPPRAPPPPMHISHKSRFLQPLVNGGGGGGGSSSTHSLPNVTSSMSSIGHHHDAHDSDRHTRVHSSGDASILSALTDSDYEMGGAVLPEKGVSIAGDGSHRGGGGAGTSRTASAMSSVVVGVPPACFGPDTAPRATNSTDVHCGMHIAIPSFLQQPILVDDDDDDTDNLHHRANDVGSERHTYIQDSLSSTVGPAMETRTSIDGENDLTAHELYDALNRLTIVNGDGAAAMVGSVDEKAADIRRRSARKIESSG
jgi:hypothetical protein